jgi:hypothetical protein
MFNRFIPENFKPVGSRISKLSTLGIPHSYVNEKEYGPLNSFEIQQEQTNKFTIDDILNRYGDIKNIEKFGYDTSLTLDDFFLFAEILKIKKSEYENYSNESIRRIASDMIKILDEYLMVRQLESEGDYIESEPEEDYELLKSEIDNKYKTLKEHSKTNPFQNPIQLYSGFSSYSSFGNGYRSNTTQSSLEALHSGEIIKLQRRVRRSISKDEALEIIPKLERSERFNNISNETEINKKYFAEINEGEYHTVEKLDEIKKILKIIDYWFEPNPEIFLKFLIQNRHIICYCLLHENLKIKCLFKILMCLLSTETEDSIASHVYTISKRLNIVQQMEVLKLIFCNLMEFREPIDCFLKCGNIETYNILYQMKRFFDNTSDYHKLLEYNISLDEYYSNNFVLSDQCKFFALFDPQFNWWTPSMDECVDNSDYKDNSCLIFYVTRFLDRNDLKDRDLVLNVLILERVFNWIDEKWSLKEYLIYLAKIPVIKFSFNSAHSSNGFAFKNIIEKLLRRNRKLYAECNFDEEMQNKFRTEFPQIIK